MLSSHHGHRVLVLTSQRNETRKKPEVWFALSAHGFSSGKVDSRQGWTILKPQKRCSDAEDVDKDHVVNDGDERDDRLAQQKEGESTKSLQYLLFEMTSTGNT